MYEAAAEDLKRVGIEASIIPINFPTWLKSWQQGIWIGEGFGYGYYLAPDMDAGKAFSAASCDKKPAVSVYYCDEAETDLLHRSQSELDPVKRRAVHARQL